MTDDVWQAVIADMHARRQVGIERYGKPVRAADPEDWLQHLTEEIYDAAVYLKALRLRLTWTDVLPTVPGWYYRRGGPGGVEWCERVSVRADGAVRLFNSRDGYDEPVADYAGAEWAGPLPEPADPAGGFPPPGGQ